MSPALLRFAIVGVAATATHVVVAWLALRALDLDPAPANGLAFVTANALSYAGNTAWSFQARPAPRNGARFVLVSLAAMAATMAIAAAVRSAGGHDALGIALVVLLVPPATYLAHRHFTYRG